MADRLFAMARKVSVSKLKRILQELLILFSRLHSGNGEPVSSKPLTDSFGWNGEEDDFLDVNLSVSDWDSVEDSLRAHTQTERLCGDNQYFCERCQCRVDASKFSRFTDLPPILTLSLSRFYFDSKLMEARKLDKLCSFPLQLDMADFVAENYTKEVLYELFSVVIHVGNTACGGHYHAYIKDPYGVLNGGVQSSKRTFEAKIVNQTNTNSSCTRDRGGLTDCRRGRYVFSNNRVARQDTLLPRRSLSLARTFGDPDNKLPGRCATQQTVFPVGLTDSGNHATTTMCRRQAMFARRGCQKPGVGTTGQPLRVSHLLGIWSSSSNKGSDLDFGASPQPSLQTSMSQREIPSASGQGTEVTRVRQRSPTERPKPIPSPKAGVSVTATYPAGEDTGGRGVVKKISNPGRELRSIRTRAMTVSARKSAPWREETLSERVKMYKAFKDNESALRGKREQKVRIEMSPKADRAKIPTLEREISELVRRVEDSEDEFETLSSAIKKELEFLDETRFQEFKTAAIGFLNTMLQIQEKRKSPFFVPSYRRTCLHAVLSVRSLSNITDVP
ncbi:Belongs to the peptidase C19 [Sparganum proliferum]